VSLPQLDATSMQITRMQTLDNNPTQSQHTGTQVTGSGHVTETQLCVAGRKSVKKFNMNAARPHYVESTGKLATGGPRLRMVHWIRTAVLPPGGRLGRRTFSFEEFTSISPLARPLFLVFRGFLSSRLFLVFIRLLCVPNFFSFHGTSRVRYETSGRQRPPFVH
jgi:hypothetical protein